MRLICEGCICDGFNYDRPMCKECIMNSNYNDQYHNKVKYKTLDYGVWKYK